VLNNALLSMGLDTLTGGRVAFLNVSHHILLSDVVTVLPPKGIVVELLENIPPTAEVAEMCRSLQRRGYTLALDDFTPGCPGEALLPFAKYVKIDLLATPPAELSALTARLLSQGLCLLAEKVETLDSLDTARRAGCSLFQGYFFARPKTFSLSAMAPRRLAYLRLLAALNQPQLTMTTLAHIIKQDASFSYRVLRSANSAAFGLRQTVRSIEEALMLIGQDRVRKWASIWALAGAGDGSTPELTTMTLLRARCCELLGESGASTAKGSDYFLLGLCSLLDVILGQPMATALKELPLSPETQEALLGGTNTERHLLDAVIAYERAAWDEANAAATRGGFDSTVLPEAYATALQAARALSQG
jgi:EAL and modified HD-GYP domain-containing signal transduction protein